MGRSSGSFVLVLVCAIPLLSGCGGGGADSVTFTVASTASVDGFVTNTAFVDTGTPVSVGDTDGSFGNVARGFVQFDRSGIPVGATILSAVLRMHQSAVFGAPYASLGNVVVDHVVIGLSLDAADFGASALQADVGGLSSNATLGLRSLDVTTQVLADIAAARSTSDFRLRFPLASDADALDDYAQFNDGDDSFGNGILPLLVVRYTGP